MKGNTLIDEYFELQLQYQRKYGPTTLVLMHQGTFYEIYESPINLIPDPLRTKINILFEEQYLPEERPQIFGKVTDVSRLMGLSKHLRNSKIVETHTNCWTAGFRIMDCESKVRYLMGCGFVVVLCDQDEEMDPVTKRFNRKVTAVLRKELSELTLESSSTGVGIDPGGGNIMVVIYIEKVSTASNNSIPLLSKMVTGKKRPEDIPIRSGVAYFNFGTGQNGVFEVYSDPSDPVRALHEIYQFLISVYPKDIFIHMSGFTSSQKDPYVRFLSGYFELDTYAYVYPQFDAVPSHYRDKSYQNEFLTKVFVPKSKDRSIVDEVVNRPYIQTQSQPQTNPGNITIKLPSKTNIQAPIKIKYRPKDTISTLGLEEYPYGLISYLLLIQYCYDHDPNILNKITKPLKDILNYDQRLVLVHNALKQMDLIESEPSIGISKNTDLRPLFSLLDYSQTPMGKRFLYARLISPLTDVEELNNCYQATSELLNNQPILNRIRSELSNIHDLEKLKRQCELKKILPRGISSLIKSLLPIQNIEALLQNTDMSGVKTYIQVDTLSHLGSCIAYLVTHVNPEILSMCKRSHIGKNRFEKCIVRNLKEVPIGHIVPESVRTNPSEEFFYYLGIYEQNIETGLSKINEIIDHLNGCLSKYPKSKPIKLERKVSKNVSGYQEEFSIGGTKGTTDILKKHYPGSGEGTLEFSSSSRNSRVSSPVIERVLENIQNNINDYYIQLEILYQHLLTTIDFYDVLDTAISLIQKLDFICSNAQNALKNNYTRPYIIEGTDKSQLELKKFRHPIVERNRNSEYITNDLSLGSYSPTEIGRNSPYGLLLRGPNMAGKTTLAKAVGLIVILAQAGYYVPCESMSYVPYRRILTRLSGDDKLKQGLSSFGVEMSELRTILNYADEYSLVLGDEFSRGTEVYSAKTLTIATIESLCQRRSTFIFSTHLDHLDHPPNLIQLVPDQLIIAHLTSHYDSNMKELVQDRKLKDGFGPKVYGLDVARSLGLPESFMNRADQISEQVLAGINNPLPGEVEGELVTPKKSKYNSGLYVDSCYLCGSRDNLETHHIAEQRHSNAQGYIRDHENQIHQNTKSNLVILCRKCHDSITHGQVSLSMTETMNGSVYIVRPIEGSEILGNVRPMVPGYLADS